MVTGVGGQNGGRERTPTIYYYLNSLVYFVKSIQKKTKTI